MGMKLTTMFLRKSNSVSENLAKPQSGCTGWMINRVIFEQKNLSLIQKTVDLAGIEKGDVVLDIGFGPGVGIEMSLKRGASLVYGLELSDYMRKKATAKLKKVDASQLRLMLGDICEGVDIPDNSIDKVINVNCVYFWNDMVAGMKHLFRIMKSGGKIVFGTRTELLREGPYNQDHFKNVQFSEIEAALKEAGFTDIVFTPRDPHAGSPIAQYDETILAVKP